MNHEAFLDTRGRNLVSVIIVLLRIKSSFPPKKDLYGLTVNNQSHLTPSRLSICLTCYFTLLALLWPRLLPGGPRPTIQATLPLLPLSPPLPRFLAFQEADLSGFPLRKFLILQKTMSIKIVVRL